MYLVLAAIAYGLIRFAVVCVWPRLARLKRAPAMVALEIPAPGRYARAFPGAERVVPATLCSYCLYAHIVRGYGAGEEMIACGYVFPMREVPFRVLECTDYKPKRERNRVDKANESAVCILPLDETTAEVHAVTVARNGEGEN